MGKIKKEHLPEILPVKRTRMTLLRAALETLEIGEGYFLPRGDWKAKNPLPQSPEQAKTSMRTLKLHTGNCF